MDYGTGLKISVENPGRRSAHYQRQTSFQGSDRQVRGAILRRLTGRNMSDTSLRKALEVDAARLATILAQLTQEGFIRKRGRTYTIA